VPEWREWVTAQHDEVVGSRASALEDVLMCLSEVERGASKNYALARIVARCEREVGDGWQVEPDLIRMCHPDRRDRCDLDCLIDALTKDGESRWTVLGGRTAAWLKAITEDEAS
jgi:hypothetical protein